MGVNIAEAQVYWDVRLLLSQPSTWIAIAIAAVVGVPIILQIKRRAGRPWWFVGLTVGAVGAILAATLGSDTLEGSRIAWRVCVLSLLDFRDGVAAIPGGVAADALPNVILYIPAGFLVALLTRRPVLTFVGLVALSAGIEIVQPYLGRACTSTDWMTNSAGALLGVAGAIAVRSLVRRRSAATRHIRVPEAGARRHPTAIANVVSHEHRKRDSSGS